MADTEIDKITAMAALMEEQMAVLDIPRLFLAVVENERVSYFQGYGFANRETKKAAEASTAFETASLSDTIIGLLGRERPDSKKLMCRWEDPHLQASSNWLMPAVLRQPRSKSENVAWASTAAADDMGRTIGALHRSRYYL